jgi:purine-binding chemotaxis protein CheW
MSEVSHLEGQYLTFQLNQQTYGMPIHAVKEIIQICEITQVPNTPRCVQGVINLRGKVIPVVNLRTRFDLDVQDFDKETCIIVIEGESGNIGAIVDNVCSVIHFAAEAIEVVDNMSNDDALSWILGMAKNDDHVAILIDIVGALAKANLEQVTKLAEALPQSDEQAA